MAPLRDHSSNLSLIALETMRLLVLISKNEAISLMQNADMT